MPDTSDLREEALELSTTAVAPFDLSQVGGSHGFSYIDPSFADQWRRQAAVVMPSYERWRPFDKAMRDAQDKLDDARRDHAASTEELEAASLAAFEIRNAQREPLTALVTKFGFESFEEWDASRMEFRRQHPGLIEKI